MQQRSETIDWSGVRTLAVAVGVREAARRLGLGEAMVRKRSSREGWLKQPVLREAAQRAVKDRAVTKALSPAVTTPAQAMLEEMRDLSGKSRLSFARGLNTAANHVEGMQGPELLQQAQNVKALTAAAGNVHGWTDHNAGPPKLRLEIVAMMEPMPLPPEFDAEWSDVEETPRELRCIRQVRDCGEHLLL